MTEDVFQCFVSSSPVSGLSISRALGAAAHARTVLSGRVTSNRAGDAWPTVRRLASHARPDRRCLVDHHALAGSGRFAVAPKPIVFQRQEKPARGEKGRVAGEECDDGSMSFLLRSGHAQAAFFQLGSSVTCGGNSATGPTGRPASSLAKPWFTSR